MDTFKSQNPNPVANKGRNSKDNSQSEESPLNEIVTEQNTSGTSNHSVTSQSMPMPRPPRRRQKPKTDRGLPNDLELSRLAEAYLERQWKHYPTAAASGIIPASSPEVILAMVEDFKRRHRGGAVDVERVRKLLKAVGVSKAGGSYNRFSSDNSNPTSIIDQLMNSLDKSLTEGHLIPWEYVYADFAVTGLDASRQGYSCYKKLLSDKQQLLQTTYIDDFTRASRDELEWWNLAELSKQYGKGLIGVSDGFDLSSPHADIMLTVYGLVSRLFIKSLTEKVDRGMKGAADRGGNLGKLPFGHTRRARLDEAGNVIVDSEGRPQTERCIDPVTAPFRRLMFELYVQKNWSATKIAEYFNQHQIDDWAGWVPRTILDLLWSSTAIGRFVWNKTRRVYNHEKKKWERKKNPRSEWKVSYRPELAIVEFDLWRKACRKRLKDRRPSKSTGRPKSRNEKSPSTLFSGTLHCACCNSQLKLVRSAGGDKQLGTIGGSLGVHGCKLPGSRSTRVIEDCMLEYLRERLLTLEVVVELVGKANAFLEEEARKPIPKTAKLKNQIANRQRKIDRLVQRSADTDDEELAASYEQAIKRFTKEQKEDQAVVNAAQAAERRKIERLDLQLATQLLGDLSALFNEDIAIAGPAIRELTGPIHIRQELVEGSKGRSRWIARFTPQVAALLQKLCPSECGQFAAASLPGAGAVEVVLEKVPKYQQLAAEFQRLRDEGVSPMEIAAKCEVGHHTLMDGLHFADTGEERRSRPKNQNNRMRYKDLASEIVRLIEEEEMQIKDVAAQLGVSESVVRRGYDHLRPDTPLRLLGPKKLCRQRTSQRVYETIRELTLKGTSVKEIAKQAGCCERTVKREQKRLADQQRADANRKSA